MVGVNVQVSLLAFVTCRCRTVHKLDGRPIVCEGCWTIISLGVKPRLRVFEREWEWPCRATCK